MSSESGRPLSMEQLKAQIRANAAMASETQTTVILTDKNWGGLTSSVTLLSELEARNSETLRRLITVQQMKDLLEEQVQNLQTDLNATEANVNTALTDLQDTLDKQTEELKTQTQRSISEISSLAGKERDRFSSACSEMTEGMKKWQRKVMWISLIPVAAVFVLELLRLIFSAV